MPDDWAVDGTLEIRQQGASRILAGTFPYNRTATVRDRGRRRKERFASLAFHSSIRRFRQLQEQLGQMLGLVDEQRQESQIDALRQARDRANIHILVGHDFNRPLGDMAGGTARVSDDANGVHFEVDLPPEADQPSWMRDALAGVRAGLLRGISPGFRMPPRGVVPNAEHDEPEPGNPGVTIRVIADAILVELSLVSRANYSETDVALRHDDGKAPTSTAREVLTWL